MESMVVVGGVAVQCTTMYLMFLRFFIFKFVKGFYIFLSHPELFCTVFRCEMNPTLHCKLLLAKYDVLWHLQLFISTTFVNVTITGADDFFSLLNFIQSA